MLAIAICILAFGVCYWATKKSLGKGLIALFVFGYAYGIVRANLVTTFAHFIFDAALAGVYMAFAWTKSGPDEKRSKAVRFWTVLLMIWPILILALPQQPFLVSLVGLRGNVFFIPCLLLGARLTRKDLYQFSVGLSVLVLIAFGFAVAEYFMGVPRFFPYSAVTQIMYNSQDVAGGFLRIPSTFINAHAFGGGMVGAIPFLIGLWIVAKERLIRWLAVISIPAALLGVLMSATRTNFVFGCAMVASILVTVKMTSKQRVFFFLLIGVVAVAALRNTRLQRFKTLDSTDYISERVAGSVNHNFWEIMTEYPMGNGLGGGGTSIPYFLEGEVRNPIGMENEYARIMSEQGVIGLLLWLCFLGWFYWRGLVAFAPGPWSMTRRLLWGYAAICFGTAWIGTGLLTSIPGTALFILGAGMAITPPEDGRTRVAPAPMLARRRSQAAYLAPVN